MKFTSQSFCYILITLIIYLVPNESVADKILDPEFNSCISSDYKEFFNCYCIKDEYNKAADKRAFDFQKSGVACKVSLEGTNKFLSTFSKTVSKGKFTTDIPEKQTNFNQCVEYHFKTQVVRELPIQFPDEKVRAAAYAELKALETE